jgi:hypothetical protein
MSLSDSFKTWLVLIAYCAIIYVLVRPGSPGPLLINDVGNAMAAAVKAGTGGSSPFGGVA